MSHAALEILDGPSRGRRFALLRDELLIGRDASCDVTLPAYVRVSRRHARLGRDANGYFIEDLGSTNGVLVNGAKVSRRQLKGGERLQLGDCTIILHLPQTDAATQSPQLERLQVVLKKMWPALPGRGSSRVALVAGGLLLLIVVPLLESLRHAPDPLEAVVSPAPGSQTSRPGNPAGSSNPGIPVSPAVAPVTEPVNGRISPASVSSVKDATVLIVCRTDEGLATGSGFVVSDGRKLVTNRHVVVDNRGRPLPCTLVFYSGTPQQKSIKITPTQIRLAPPSQDDDGFRGDLALITLDTPLVTALPLGKAEKLSETDEVYAAGFPLGIQTLTLDNELPSVSIKAARIERMQQKTLNNKTSVTVLQLGGTITQGNSGGPVVNDRGEVVGVISRGAQGTGMAYAIPTTFVRALLKKK